MPCLSFFFGGCRDEGLANAINNVFTAPAQHDPDHVIARQLARRSNKEYQTFYECNADNLGDHAGFHDLCRLDRLASSTHS